MAGRFFAMLRWGQRAFFSGGIKKGREPLPAFYSQVANSIGVTCCVVQAVGGCRHATSPVHPTTSNRAEDRILIAPSDGPQQNGIFHMCLLVIGGRELYISQLQNSSLAGEAQAIQGAMQKNILRAVAGPAGTESGE